MNLLNQVLHGAAEVSMVKLVFQSAAEVLHCQQEADAVPRYNLFRRLVSRYRVDEAREQLKYVLLRDRFVRIPVTHGRKEGEEGDEPGDDFEMHSYLLRTCCEQVRSYFRRLAASPPSHQQPRHGTLGRYLAESLRRRCAT